MALSPSPPPGGSTATDSDGASSSENSESADAALPLPATKKLKRNQTSKPYARASSNVYAASSSLLNIGGRPLSHKRSLPASADEILFSSSGSPGFSLPDEVQEIMRDQETIGALPDSDLLKAVHAYAAEFYAAKGWGVVGERSMDESALIAVGVLLEEWCREMIGKQGDLVFVDQEGE
ncbi:hypothetical protein DRE_06616 [Drechslerella stenobrocha 248]|uniref:Uncharacterized protein n=1 Tax=Drechslerella stenobrocha 248 TaxID=1043628 RepID=W7HX03_9PEZI|nr:hypothetical protein DRE_06616 [Drechslerella stenobrocha 248]